MVPTAMDDKFSNEIGLLDAHAQAELVCSGEVSAPELIEAAISRIVRLDPVLNAVSYRAFDLARARASTVPRTAAWRGVPYLVKDSLDYIGMPSRCASRALSAGPARTQHEFISRFDRQGLIPLGKSNMPEFALMAATESLLYGPTVNPWDISRSPGGSSGGAGAAVAAGMLPIAHASDGGGSIRIPASCCGTLGLKTSRGVNARARAWHLIDDFLASDGFLARSVRDLAWTHGIASSPLSSKDWIDTLRKPPRRLRVAVAMRNLVGELPAQDVQEVIRRTMRLMDSLGHIVEECELPSGVDQTLPAFKTLWTYAADDAVARVAGRRDMLEPWTLQLAQAVRRIEVAQLETVWRHVTDLDRLLSGVFQGYDVVLSPVLKTPPVERGALAPTRPFDALFDDMFDYVSYTPLNNLAGTPAISVPLFRSHSGPPIGSMFSAARGQEDLLLSLAFQLEEAAPWHDQWPPISVKGRSC